MQNYDIVRLTTQLKEQLHTNNPFQIAEACGISVLFRSMNPTFFKAHTIKTEGYPTLIAINEHYSPLSQQLLCAHELGHALMHDDFINHFAITQKNLFSSVEYEANLFAVSLLFDDDRFNIPIVEIDSYSLKNIIDLNMTAL